ncbi:PQQ-binding-like beta-propeller repeat protein [Streptomyces sp. N2-109]|uniref:non-specific serine/threonine protein kinase n=1 Tax=Streptomyces gossypii TaxID=2883101 RepID=A0ABT2JZI4_9ACTN|nr:PQQ-binding-like beta-propeller repeat protein [Streptomyces gossypii]MCT2592644.1 PQQ-binding-like beta-propeller repeat protein [Streptomyces gossypii]
MVEQLTQHDPRRIGPFEVLGRLGAGGMGLVYLARSASGRRVAIKTVRTELAEDQLFRVRFTREVEAARAVSGFYTAAVVDADARAAVPWLATAYVPAPSLEEIVNECGPLPVQAVRWLAAGIAEALQSIHGAGLVHRDLKPSNVLVVEDGPRVIDFGIASGVSNTRLTMTNVAVGTPAYMSPEQARDSRSVTGASDIFSLASTLVFAATGHAPFHGANPVETVFMLLREGPDLSGMPEDLGPLIDSCMRMAAEERPSPADLQTQLAPHLFSSAGDDSGTASAWLPSGAVALIERKRGARTPRPQGQGQGGQGQGVQGQGGQGDRGQGQAGGPRHGAGTPQSSAVAGPDLAAMPQPHASPPSHAAPPPPPASPPETGAGPPVRAPYAPDTAPMGANAAESSDWDTAWRPEGRGSIPAGPGGPAAVGAGGYPAASLASPPAAPPSAPGPDGSHVQLPGAKVPIGPGPRRTDDLREPDPASGPGSGWVRPPNGAHGAHAAAPPSPPAHAGHAAHAAPPVSSPGPSRAGPPPRPPAPGTPAAPPAPPSAQQVPPPDGGTPPRWRPWRFRMSNDVWGTPVVADDLLYVTSFEVHALDVATGRRQFKTREVAWSMAVSGGRVHASDGPSLYALDAADGSERWRLATDGWVYSLKVDRGTVVTGTRGGGVQTWEASTGERLWELSGAQADFETPEAGPVIHNGTVYTWGDGRLYAMEARTGTERWAYPVGDSSATGGVPVRLTVADDGAVYICAGSRVFALDAASGAERWRFDAPAAFLCAPAFVPGPAVAGGGIYLADYLGTVYALDAVNGHDRWRIATESRHSTEPVVVVDGLVHLGSGGALYTLDAVSGTPRWRFAASGDVIGAPVVAAGRVHFGSADHCLYTLDAVGGQLRWKLATGGEITGSPVAVGGVIYACSKDRCVYALDAAKGTGQSRQG